MQHQDWTQVVFKKTDSIPKSNKASNAVVSHVTGQPMYKLEGDDGCANLNKVSKEEGRQILGCRVAKKMTQINLAQSTNLPLKTIQEIERGDAIRGSAYHKVRKYLGLGKFK